MSISFLVLVRVESEILAASDRSVFWKIGTRDEIVGKTEFQRIEASSWRISFSSAFLDVRP